MAWGGKAGPDSLRENPGFSVMIDAPADENQRFPGHVSYQGIASAMP
jgi:hypothetical protein